MIKAFASSIRGFRRPLTGIPSLPSEAGMSLLEILIVLSIIGVIFTVLASGLLDKKQGADIQIQEMALHRLAEGLDLYRMRHRHFPSTEEGLDALVKEKLAKKSDLTDNFDTPVTYEKNEGGFVLRSAGPDQKPETDDDIVLDSQTR